MASRNQRCYNAAYYRRNRITELARVTTRQKLTRDFLRAMKSVPCADCGGTFAAPQMDFDHREPSEKSFWLMSGRAMLASVERLTDEAAKCDIVCANCHRQRTKARRAARPANTGSSRYIERRRAYWRAQSRLLDQLRDVACADCSRRFPPWAMDFDHRDPVQKRAQVTQMIGRAGMAKILAEASKCDVVCANCHRLRTYNRSTAALERE